MEETFEVNLAKNGDRNEVEKNKTSVLKRPDIALPFSSHKYKILATVMKN